MRSMITSYSEKQVAAQTDLIARRLDDRLSDELTALQITADTVAGTSGHGGSWQNLPTGDPDGIAMWGADDQERPWPRAAGCGMSGQELSVLFRDIRQSAISRDGGCCSRYRSIMARISGMSCTVFTAIRSMIKTFQLSFFSGKGQAMPQTHDGYLRLATDTWTDTDNSYSAF